jgi:hypothetical protein
VLDFKYGGGIEQFKLDIPNHSYKEDDYLVSVRFLTTNETFNFISFVKDLGLHYDEKSNHSDDFALFSWIGHWWDADWLVTDIYKCWHKESN